MPMQIRTYSIQQLVGRHLLNNTRRASLNSCWRIIRKYMCVSFLILFPHSLLFVSNFLFLISFLIPLYCRYQEDRRRGNPTKSKRITTLINAIKKTEVQGKGKPSEARSPFTDPEYRRIMRIIEGIGDIGKRLFCSALLRYQLSMGARVDDTSKLSKTNIKCNSEPALEQLSLTTKLCWSKNIATQKQGMYVIVCFVSSNYYLLLLSSNSFFLSLFQLLIRYCLEPVTSTTVFFSALLVS